MRTCIASVLGLGAMAIACHGEYITIAQDDASNYTNWVHQSTGGTGFDNWVIHASGADGFGGAFLANTGSNTDLNNVYTTPGEKAWGTFANGGTEGEHVACFRGFGWNGSSWDNSLDAAGDTFRISFEHGNVDENMPGLVGFALRNDNKDSGTGDYDSFERFELGFRGGTNNYYIIDGNGTVDTGVSWRDGGLHVVFRLQEDTSMYAVTLIDAATQTVAAKLSGPLTGSGSIDSVALFNRDSILNGDTFFNSLVIQYYEEPTVFILR